jgi:hypothetical protein
MAQPSSDRMPATTSVANTMLRITAAVIWNSLSSVVALA